MLTSGAVPTEALLESSYLPLPHLLSLDYQNTFPKGKLFYFCPLLLHVVGSQCREQLSPLHMSNFSATNKVTTGDQYGECFKLMRRLEVLSDSLVYL